MDGQSSIFDRHTKSYLEQLKRLDFAALADRLGVTVAGRNVTVPVFGQPYHVSSGSVHRSDGRPADYTVTVIVCCYLLQCPDFYPGQDQWQSYKDFPDAAPLVDYFSNNVEKSIADHFSGRLDRLRHAAETLGGQPPSMELSYDFLATFDALPRVPVLLLFNTADEDFPAQSSVLFENRARHYLDMECLAMVGSLLAGLLIRSA